MKKALFFSVVIAVALGASWFGFHQYRDRAKGGQRLLSIDTLMPSLEAYIANPLVFPQVASKIGNYLDRNVGNCLISSSNKGLNPNFLQITIETRFQFSSIVNLNNTGALCYFPGYGGQFLALSSPQASVEIERRPGRASLFRLLSGKVKISSDQLHFDLDIFGNRLQLKSAGPVTLEMSAADRGSILLLSGKLEIASLQDVLKAPPPPLWITISNISILQSEGKIVGEKGETVMLLPSGFVKLQNSSAEPQAAPNVGNQLPPTPSSSSKDK